MAFKSVQLCRVAFVIINVLASCVMTSPVVRRQRSDDRGPLEAIVEQLSQQVSSLNAEVAALKTQAASSGKTVAFHAWSTQNKLIVGALSPIVLDHAVTNIGNAYDTASGVFTAPFPGLYDFQAAIMNYDRTSSSVLRGALYVGNSIEAITISDSRHGFYNHGTMKAIVHLQAGQKVYLKNPDSTAHNYFDGGGLPYTTFSGFLIKAD